MGRSWGWSAQRADGEQDDARFCTPLPLTPSRATPTRERDFADRRACREVPVRGAQVRRIEQKHGLRQRCTHFDAIDRVVEEIRDAMLLDHDPTQGRRSHSLLQEIAVS